MNWRTYLIDEIKAGSPYSLVGGPFGSDLTTRDYVDDGVPIVRGNNLPDDRKFIDDGYVFVSEEKATKLRTNIAYPEDVIVTQRGTLGQVGLIPKDAAFDRYVVSQSQMKLTVDRRIALPDYVYYWFRQSAVREQIKRRAITSGVPHINLGIFKRFEIRLPSLEQQRETLQVLNGVEDLIENNRRRIQLLEESARLLYREWFVHLRFPGHEHVRVVDGVPEGWERKPLGQSVVLNYGKALKAENRIDGPYPVFGSSGVVGTHAQALVAGPAIIVGRKGNVGSIYWSAASCYPIDTVYFIDAAASNLYLYYALRHMQFVSTDVAVPGLNRDFAYSRPLLAPAENILRAFLDVAVPIRNQIDKLEETNKKLAQARNLLLPRLMSGEITL